ncbi:NAD-dependent epimerase/dehydratase family protein [Thermomonospora umbrina]|uniref:Nucleoside-diphosphate-sugar epimerase n=1 Tax=Thermomonospora umbrina TaxID=111806 RepID=A0A3D9SRV7_9ACTN|nr:NAD-dependent epimerase/dehydratase family protein [Thermomonospora umbrina]REE97210.1 nucleoside-diphosphate-sugar epimerase [Thermomonospora umbrina]
MRVLVTGVSGTVGSAVARALLRHDHQVVGVVKSIERPVPEGVEPLAADLFEPGALTEVAGRVDGAVHAASSNDERAGLLDGAVVGTLLDAFEGTGRPLVYTSGLWLHGDTGGVPATEESPFDPPMAVSWRPAVEDVLIAGAERGVRAIRIRPALVYGGGAGHIPAVLAPQPDGDGRVVRHFGDGNNRWSLVHADDLGELYALALESAPAGSVYLGTDDRPVRVRDIAEAIADRHDARVQPWDPDDAAQYWGLMVEPFLLDQVATGAKARSELGWRPQGPSVLKDLTEWP